MSQKTLYYAQLAKDTARRLTGNWERWAGFLSTAARLYKYPYPDQLMIYAQRPGRHRLRAVTMSGTTA